MRRLKVVSGGQTGVDRAALDVALELGWECGGWCPAGRAAEDGPIPLRYPLRATVGEIPSERTTLNVIDSDATLLITSGAASPGSDVTRAVARGLERPVYTWHVTSPADVGSFRRWLQVYHVATLNVAGPRESESPGVYAAARDLLRTLLAGPLPFDP